MRPVSKLLAFVGAAVACGALVTAVAVVSAAQSGPINVRNPEIRAKDLAPPPPMLIPPANVVYTPASQGVPVRATGGRPVAQFGSIPAGFRLDAYHLPPSGTVSADKVAYTILSSVRYKAGDATVLLTATRPTAAAAQRPNYLGNQTVRLADGSAAWTKTNSGAEFSNSVVMVKSGLIITIAGNLPIDQLNALATRVSVA